MEVEVKFVDAFTVDNRAETGNPAAVVVLTDGYVDAQRMQVLARKIGLSETAYLVPQSSRDKDDRAVFNIRWFTPAAEVDLCGHATLASAKAIEPIPEVTFLTQAAGELHVTSSAGRHWLDFPLLPATPAAPVVPGLLSALGLETCACFYESTYDCIVQLASATAVASVQPDFEALGRAAVRRGVIVTAAVQDDERKDETLRDADFVSRFFAPAVGINEDPVTGSAHCALASLWWPRLGAVKGELTAVQLSARSGVVKVKVPAEDPRRVKLGGLANVHRTERRVL